jgi:excisionase family DNA binding protein
MDWFAVPVMPSGHPDDDLLKPREVAEVFGVRTTTIARWAREGKLMPLRTPGGHRRYRLQDIRQLMGVGTGRSEVEEELIADAVRLHDQGWSIRQVAEKFGCSYGAMRRILKQRTTLRDRARRGLPSAE